MFMFMSSFVFNVYNNVSELYKDTYTPENNTHSINHYITELENNLFVINVTI